MCWVLPLGVCDSAAAAPLRDVLLRYRVFEIADLEDVAHALFPSAIASTRATVAPILLFVERTAAGEGATTRLVRVTKPCLGEDRLNMEKADISEIPQTVFATGPVNPYGQILTKLRDQDLPILEKLLADGHVSDFAEDPTPGYGVTVARAGVITDRPGPGLLPLLKGLNISTYYLNPSSSQWVDPMACRSPSIWGNEALRVRPSFVVSNISLAPQAATIDPAQHAINDSAIVFVPKQECSGFPWDVLLNSAPVP